MSKVLRQDVISMEPSGELTGIKAISSGIGLDLGLGQLSALLILSIKSAGFSTELERIDTALARLSLQIHKL